MSISPTTIACTLVVGWTIAFAAKRRPASLARVAGIIVGAHGLLVAWVSWSAKIDTKALLVASIGGGLAVALAAVAAMTALAFRERDGIAQIGACLYGLGWLLHALLSTWVIAFVYGTRTPIPDIGMLPWVVIAVGGLAVSKVPVQRVDDPRRRRTLLVVLAVYGVVSVAMLVEARAVLAAIGEHDPDMSAIAAHRTARDLCYAGSLLALAAVLQLGERWKPADPVPRAEIVS